MKIIGVAIKFPSGIALAAADDIPPVFWRYARENPTQVVAVAGLADRLEHMMVSGINIVAPRTRRHRWPARPTPDTTRFTRP